MNNRIIKKGVMILYINFNKIVVDTIESESGVFIGYNDASSWSSISKTQEIIGTIKGFSNFISGIGFIDDNDVLDMPIYAENKIKSVRPNLSTKPVKIKKGNNMLK
jgi:hypothetical protein